jgi:hypothetical protein
MVYAIHMYKHTHTHTHTHTQDTVKDTLFFLAAALQEQHREILALRQPKEEERQVFVCVYVFFFVCVCMFMSSIFGFLFNH